MKKAAKVIKRVSLIIPAMGGILLDEFSSKRIILLALLGLIYFSFKELNSIADFKMSLTIFFTLFITRYVFLFSSFIKNGIADKIKKKFGEEKGFDLYQTITAVMFFAGGLSFSLMVIKSGISIPLYGYYNTIFQVLGFSIALAGMIINTWSTYLVGVDIYYYKDLFVGRKLTEFMNKGPYKIFSNPMYGPGQANGYGTALTYGSATGITGILLNQIMMYIFFYTVEKPHIMRILKKEKAETNLKN